MEIDEKMSGTGTPVEEQVRPKEGVNDLRRNSQAQFEQVRLEDTLRSLKKVIWILAMFIALLCAISVVNMVIAKKAIESSQRHLAPIERLSESLKEIQKTTAQLKKMIEDLSEADEGGGQGEPDQGQTWNGSI